VTSYSFRVYVAGQTERTQAAIVNLRFLCDLRAPGRYEVEIIDILESPDLAERAGIFVAPTIERVTPLPRRRVFGDLSDHARTVMALGLPDLARAGEGGEAP
jgi:circadian clock protein KaiB